LLATKTAFKSVFYYSVEMYSREPNYLHPHNIDNYIVI